MIRFAHEEYLYALAALPLLALVYVWAVYARKRALQRFASPALIARLAPAGSRYKRTVKFAAGTLALCAVVVGLANPQIGTKMEEVRREGVDIVIAIDVSNSMRAEDIRPNRLESAKQAIGRMIDRLQNDRLGLIVFGGESYLQLPLTSDYSAARLILSAIDVDVVPVQGTAIGSAIRLAMKSFVGGEKKHKVIVVITDGENHEDDALAAASDASKEGAIVHTIGMGSPEGAPIPIYQNGVRIGFKQDRGGGTVITKLDEQALAQVAGAGGGRFIRATNQQRELEAVLKEIESMEKKEFGARVFTEYEDRFQYLLIVAIALLVIDAFVSERKNRLLAGLTLFGGKQR